MELRSLLCFARQADVTDACRRILSAEWVVHSARDFTLAKTLVDDGGCSVGLVAFDRSDDPGCLEVEELVASNHTMEWIAVLHDDCVMTERFLEFLLDSFYMYHQWPPDPAVLLPGLEHAWERAALRRRRMAADDAAGESTMIGISPAMKYVFRSLRKIAAVDAPTLITGESGTGKELAAIAIHRRSSRSTGSFVAVNCGALPADLIQSELFGHERGAFTGAYYAKKGLLESAAGGTVFLDEIGDLSLELQTNLLRFLQERTINRIGSTSSIPLQVRVIAATHVNLENAVKERRFREDLYYRLNVLHLVVPPLRDRAEDIPLLAQFFFKKFSNEKQLRVKGFSHRASQAMISYPWPGNVRELINRIRHPTSRSGRSLSRVESRHRDSRISRSARRDRQHVLGASNQPQRSAVQHHAEAAIRLQLRIGRPGGVVDVSLSVPGFRTDGVSENVQSRRPRQDPSGWFFAARHEAAP